MAEFRGLDSATTARESIYQNLDSPDLIQPAPKHDANDPSPLSSGRDGSSESSTSQSSVSLPPEKDNGEKEEQQEVEEEKPLEEPASAPWTSPLDRTLSRSHEVWKFRMRAADDDEPEYVHAPSCSFFSRRLAGHADRAAATP